MTCWGSIDGKSAKGVSPCTLEGVGRCDCEVHDRTSPLGNSAMTSLLMLSSKSDWTAKPTDAWTMAHAAEFCPRCRTMLPSGYTRAHNLDLDANWFQDCPSLEAPNVGPMVVVWLSGIQVLRCDVLEQLPLPSSLFHRGSVSIGGTYCTTYLTVTPDPTIRCVLRPHRWITQGVCTACGRGGGQPDGNAGYWFASAEVGDRPVIADDYGGGPYVSQPVLDGISPTLRAELRFSSITVK